MMKDSGVHGNPMANNTSAVNMGQKDSQKLAKNLTYALDESVYKVMEVFKAHDQSTYQEKVVRVRSVLQNLVDNCRSMQQKDEGDDPEEKSQYKIKANQLLARSDAHSKIISELEAKLFESERQRIQLKSEKESLQF